MESPTFLKFTSLLVEAICRGGGLLVSSAQAEPEQTSHPGDRGSARRDQASRHACALGSAHQFVRSQEQRECERLIITSGTDWAPAEEEFSTSLQAPPGQMALLRAAALCVRPGS